jgi:hypothetical protein
LKFPENTVVKTIAFLLFFAATGSYAFGQCAMCKAVAEDSINNDGYGIALGLNNGIMLLMFVPYILLGTLLFVFFRKQIGGFLKSFSNIH